MPQNTPDHRVDTPTQKSPNNVYHTGKSVQLDGGEFNSWIRLFIVGMISLLFIALLFVFLKNF